MASRSAQVIDVPQERTEETVAVLTRAFAHDPLMRYLCDEQEDALPTRLHAFFDYTCAVQRELGWPLLGVVPRTRLAGAVGVAMPEQPEWPDSLTTHYKQLIEKLGDVAADRIERYATLTSTHFPKEPLCYVKMIGVRPESQGRGYARLLLDAVHQLSATHSTSTGVGLDTENPANVPLYESFGYRVLAEVKLEDLTIWCMFRPDEA